MINHENEFRKKKPVILFIYNYSCHICGLVSLNLHVHHIDNNHKNNFVFNLIPLCEHCHRLVHQANVLVVPQPTYEQNSQLERLQLAFKD